MPLSRYTLGVPDPDKWKHHAANLDIALPLVEKSVAKAREVFARPPQDQPVERQSEEAQQQTDD
ncbi:MAG: hypothetical protein WCD36_03145 [Rhodanobacteraceae bacterium]